MSTRRRRGAYIRGLSPAVTRILREKKAAEREPVHCIKLSDGIFKRWSALRSSMNLSTHSELAAKLIHQWYMESRSGQAVASLEIKQEMLTPTQQTTSLKERDVSSLTEDPDESASPMNIPGLVYETNNINKDRVEQKQPPSDTSNSVTPTTVISTPTSLSGSDKQELQSSHVDDSECGRSNCITETGESKRSNMDVTEHISFHAIQGLPVYLPFSMNYFSAKLNSLIQSKVYVIVEQADIADYQMSPIKINVRGDVHEVTSDGLDITYYQELQLGRLFNWVNIAGVENNENIDQQTSFQSKERLEIFNLQGAQGVQQKHNEQLILSCEDTENTHGMNQFMTRKDMKSCRINDKDKQTYFDMAENDQCGKDDDESSNGEYIIRSIISEVLDNVHKCAVSNSCDFTANSEEQPDILSETSSESEFEANATKNKIFFKFDENSDPNSLPRSSRLRSKGYRIDYSKLDGQGCSINESDDNDGDDISNSDHDNDSTKTDVNDINSDVIADTMVDQHQSMDEKRENRKRHSNRKGRVSNKRKKVDPDYVPVNTKPEGQDCDSESNNDSSGSDSTSDEESWDDGLEFDENYMKQKYNSVQNYLRLKKEKLLARSKRIVVKLDEHKDKYSTENQVSVRMMDRGKSDAEKTIEVMVCVECKIFRTSDKSQMERHLENHLNKDFWCKRCDFVGKSFREKSIHVSQVHRSSVGRHKCFMCKERFGLFKQYEEHVSKEHNLPPWICKTCSTLESPVSFENKVSYKEHLVENHKELLDQCTRCGLYLMKGGTSSEKKLHRCEDQKMITEKTTCDICGKVMRKDHLNTHKNSIHFKTRMFPCTKCEYVSGSSYQLKHHMKAKHEGVHPHKCDQCDFTCVRSFQLVSHKRTHTGHKPYKCDKCPYAAHWNVQLKTHQKLHGSPIGQECEICSIVVRKGATFVKHMKNEHGQEAK